MGLCLGNGADIQYSWCRGQVSEEEKAVAVMAEKACDLGPDVGRSTY